MSIGAQALAVLSVVPLAKSCSPTLPPKAFSGLGFNAAHRGAEMG